MNFLDKQLEHSVGYYFPSQSAFKRYQSVLQKYWSNKPQETLDLLTKEIESSDGLEIDSIYYRLWIEQLSDLNDKCSLTCLQKHLVQLSGVSYLNKDTLRALRGLIHLELDEVHACSHLSKLIVGNLDNPYCLEFYQRYKARFSSDGRETLFLLMTKVPLIDYFHWQTLSRSLLTKGKYNLLDRFLKYIDTSFEKSPLFNEFEMFRLLDSGHYSMAEKIASSLSHRYSKKTEYQFIQAYLLSCSNKHKESNKILLNLVKKHKETDADIFSLLGYNSYLSSFGDIYSSHWENAIRYFLKAEEYLNNMGYPTKEILLNLSLINRTELKSTTQNGKEDVSSRKSYNYWLVNLDAKSFFSLATSEEEEIRYQFHEMGSSPREGDLIFFMSDKNNSSSSRLGAIYQALSTPLWDNLDGYQTILELVKRFDRSVLLSDEFKYEESDLILSAKSLTKPNEKGVYLLSDKGLDVIGDLVIKQIDDDKLTQVFEEIKSKKVS